MFSHVMIGSNDLERSKKFYDAVFTAIGGREGRVDPKGRVMYLKDGGIFIITKPIDGEAATHGNGCTLGFSVTGPEQAHAWHEAGIAAGGTPIEDDPGVRSGMGVNLYLAYLRDPDGNKICAMHRMPADA
ncbi:catechol 2,3-dioxygenase-like lactoylglutathione lyase family enzyme [Sphingomonas kaistensis]|uniref:Catechol 2,3-dioxygenase-like lactoylglutathione lyase family enzyme n=1 Tax=Sphingomonas kaistensis TaxID=298708 RepID=A0A7X5Y3I4_9SPHN|nr:VOC family protein [Sphingomonas kaistensis]NJC04513.1 catechol 2,3-dioxygenase-like lactoylglutathione lyase family enzyme [Sphingomonas kaistensis]